MMDADVKAFVLEVLASADYHPRGEQIATLVDLYTRAVAQLGELPEDEPK